MFRDIYFASFVIAVIASTTTTTVIFCSLLSLTSSRRVFQTSFKRVRELDASRELMLEKRRPVPGVLRLEQLARETFHSWRRVELRGNERGKRARGMRQSLPEHELDQMQRLEAHARGVVDAQREDIVPISLRDTTRDGSVTLAIDDL